jgi:hypothetical protein
MNSLHLKEIRGFERKTQIEKIFFNNNLSRKNKQYLKIAGTTNIHQLSLLFIVFGEETAKIFYEALIEF